MKRQILLYDGECNLCDRTVRFVKKRDVNNNFKFFSLQSQDGRAILNEYNVSPEENKSVVYIKDNQLLQKSDAIVNIMYDLGGSLRILYSLRYIPKPIRDFFYDLIARYRYSVFGKKKDASC